MKWHNKENMVASIFGPKRNDTKEMTQKEQIYSKSQNTLWGCFSFRDISHFLTSIFVLETFSYFYFWTWTKTLQVWPFLSFFPSPTTKDPKLVTHIVRHCKTRMGKLGNKYDTLWKVSKETEKLCSFLAFYEQIVS